MNENKRDSQHNYSMFGKVVYAIVQEYSEDFNKVINKFKWCFDGTPIEKEDILNIFLFKIPDILQKHSKKKGANLKTYLCTHLKNLIFNYSRKQRANKYRVLNEAITFKEEKYAMPTVFVRPELNYSVLTKFEYLIFLTIFESCKTIAQASQEHQVSRYVIETTLIQIKLKMKKQLQ